MTKRIKCSAFNSRTSSTPFVAREDAEKKSSVNSKLYTAMQKQLAETSRELICEAYNYREIYTNFRQKFIAIKVDRPETRNRDGVMALDRIFAGRGYDKVLTPQGIIFRIPR